MKYFRILASPPAILICILVLVYWQFFFRGFIPVPADTLVGAYFPWYDYNWGYAVHVPVKNALISDVFSQFFLWKYLSIDLIKSGQLPLWNIYSFTGTPMLATYHSAVLNPFNLFLLLPKYYGWGFYIFAQSLLAALGMYVLLGKFINTPAAKISGALIFTFSGLMTTWTEFGTGVYAAAMLPWIFFSLINYFETKKLRHLFLMSIFFLLLYLAGHAQLTLYSSALVLIYSIVFGKFKKTLLVGGFVILSISLAMIQLLPSYEFAKESIREAENYGQYFNHGLSPVYESVRFFAADFFGNPATGNHWSDQSYHEQTSFLGSITLIFILPFLFKRFRDEPSADLSLRNSLSRGYSSQNKNINFWGLTFLATLVVFFDSSVSRFLYSQPLPFLTYSSAARIFFISSFAVAILAAIGIEKYYKDAEFFKIARRCALFLLAGIIGMLIGFYIVKEIAERNADLILVKNFSVTIRNLILPLFFVGAIVFISYIKLIPKRIILILILLILFIDLGRYFQKYNPFVPQHIIFPDTPITEYLKNRNGQFRILRTESDVMPPNTWTHYKLQSIEGYDPLYSKDYAEVFNVINGLDFYNTPSRYREVISISSPFINALNVKYILKSNDNPDEDLKNPQAQFLKENYKEVFSDKSVTVYENPFVLPRAYFAEELIGVNSEEELARIISEKSFDPAKNAAIVSEPTSSRFERGQVDIINYESNAIDLKTTSKDDGFLVFADNYDEGWHLLRNGEEEKIYKVNGSFRGFSAPAGINIYRMYYWPDYVDKGLKISMLAGLAFVVLIIFAVRKKIF